MLHRPGEVFPRNVSDDDVHPGFGWFDHFRPVRIGMKVW
ncbi:hypothetical protein DB30_06412 [Enhygromyxa salina]|uniref:Uncharacterized protein n=1 Tax=Enhygromyxa salina TaxID=215803 RepID=A0A0C2CU57_9BACT|nr:hypothetical protein DB30_06412 [Enhygromyxa salina]